MAASADRVRVEIADGIADVRMTRADKHNGLDAAMFEALHDALARLRADTDAAGDATEPQVRAVVLSGEGPSFCAGLDFKSFMSGDAGSGNGGGMGNAFERSDRSEANYAQRVAHGWRELPVPVIAALRGACLGGGLQIALAADIRYAAPDTRMSVMEMRYGLIPDMGLSQTLPGLVRDDVARELTYTARIVEAPEAAALGLVSRLADDPHAAAMETAAQIAASSPSAIRSAKRLLGQAAKLSSADGLALEAELQQALIGTPEQLAAVAASMGARRG